MEGKWGRMLALIAAEVLVLGMLAGNSGRASQAPDEADGLSGSIRIVGSTSMEKLTCALAECFMEKYPGVTVTVQFTGSSAGIEAVSNGSADIGISSRDLLEEEKRKGVVENIVALDGIAVCVDSGNTVAGLSMEQLIAVFKGDIRYWSDVGGGDMPIVVVGREAGSGTRESFEALLGIKDQCSYANELDGMGTVLARVGATPGAIGYVSFDVIEEQGNSERRQMVSPITLDGVEPTAENVEEGRYPLSRPFFMVTNGDVSSQSELLRRWFAFVYSEEGQELVEASGLIRAK